MTTVNKAHQDNLNAINEFVEYVLSFYAKGEIYDMNVTKDEVLVATGIRIGRYKNVAFDGDSIDREKVRDIILELRAA